MFRVTTPPSLPVLEYADVIPFKVLKRLLLPEKKRVVLSMTLNCNWWWGSSSGNLGNVEYPLPLVSDLLWPGVAVYMGGVMCEHLQVFNIWREEKRACNINNIHFWTNRGIRVNSKCGVSHSMSTKCSVWAMGTRADASKGQREGLFVDRETERQRQRDGENERASILS